MKTKARKIYEVFYCMVAGTALLMAFFDATYLAKIPYLNLSFRDVYLLYVPDVLRHKITAADLEEDPRLEGKVYDRRLLLYDPVKGIRVHRATRDYLRLVDDLTLALESEQKQTDSQAKRAASIEAERILDRLRKASVRLVDNNPFRLANKSGDLERIKNLMRDFAGRDSSKASFTRFWSQEEIRGLDLRARLEWFDAQIRPIMERNYFRWIGEDGQPEDHYHRLDRWFVLFFLLDFLFRWGLSIYRREYRRWYVFVIRNWTEIFNLYPPPHSSIWRLLRAIPFFQRMGRNGFLPSSGLASAIVHDHAAVIAEEISGMVVLNILREARERIQRQGLQGLALQDKQGLLQKIERLLDDEADFISREILPEVAPEITDLVKFSIRQAFASYLKSPLGPGVRLMLRKSFEQIEAGLEAALASPEGAELMNHILHDFIRHIIEKGSSDENLSRLEQGIIEILDSVIASLEKN